VLRGRIIALKQSALYEGANFTHFRELLEELEEREGAAINYTTLTKILKDAGIASKRSHRYTPGGRYTFLVF
jgi:hypothetical protein